MFLILFVALAVFIPLLSWFTGKYAEFWVKKLVTEKADAIYEILQTGEAPLSWRIPVVNGVAGGKLQQKINIMKIRGLKRYMERSPLFPADKKDETVRELEAVRKEWEK